jgi:nitroreductase
MRRRALLAAPLAACGPLTACNDAPSVALSAWRGPPPDLADARLAILSWALLAPSPCNTQPWRATWRAGDIVALDLDPGRLLPARDPDGRQARIALGGFVELMALAAGARGLRAEPAAPDAAVLSVRLTGPAAAPDPLFAALPRRRSSRRAFDPEKPVTPADAAALTRAAGGRVTVGFAVEPGRVAALGALAAEARAAAAALPPVAAEEAGWLRLDAAEVAARRDGIAVTGPAVWLGRRLGLVSADRIATPGTVAGRVAALFWRNLFAGTASFGWLATDGDGPGERLLAGRAYQRLDLAAAGAGVAIHPVSEALGDRPELAASRRELERLTGTSRPRRVQMLFRLGYAGPQAPTPRRAPGAILVE